MPHASKNEIPVRDVVLSPDNGGLRDGNGGNTCLLQRFYRNQEMGRRGYALDAQMQCQTKLLRPISCRRVAIPRGLTPRRAREGG